MTTGQQHTHAGNACPKVPTRTPNSSDGQKQLTNAERLAGIIMAAILEVVMAITVADAGGHRETKTTPIKYECN